MNTIPRRTLLALTTSALALAACAGTTAASLASDVQLVDSGASALASAVMQLVGVPAATVTQIQGYLATINTGAAAVQAGTANDATIVQQVVGAVQALVPVVLPLLPGGSAFVPVANALLSMAPALLAWVGISGAPAVAAAYTPDQARLILRALPK